MIRMRPTGAPPNQICDPVLSNQSVRKHARPQVIASQRANLSERLYPSGENIYGHLFAQDRALILDAMNQAVNRLYAYESQEPGPDEGDEAVA